MSRDTFRHHVNLNTLISTVVGGLVLLAINKIDSANTALIRLQQWRDLHETASELETKRVSAMEDVLNNHSFQIEELSRNVKNNTSRITDLERERRY